METTDTKILFEELKNKDPKTPEELAQFILLTADILEKRSKAFSLRVDSLINSKKK